VNPSLLGKPVIFLRVPQVGEGDGRTCPITACWTARLLRDAST
jgi:hypothetical protein